MEDFSYVLTVVKKCIIVTKLCKERFAFLFFLFVRLSFFLYNFHNVSFSLALFLEKNQCNSPFVSIFIWMLSKKVLPLHRFFKKVRHYRP